MANRRRARVRQIQIRPVLHHLPKASRQTAAAAAAVIAVVPAEQAIRTVLEATLTNVFESI